MPYYLVFSLSIDLLAYTNADICHREYLVRLSLIPVRLSSLLALTMAAVMLISMCRRIPVLLSPLPFPFIQFIESRSRYELDACVISAAVCFACNECGMCCGRATLEVRPIEKIASICYRNSSYVGLMPQRDPWSSFPDGHDRAARPDNPLLVCGLQHACMSTPNRSPSL